jgi:adenine phosphoribosyltransferase
MQPETLAQITATIRDVPDFPNPGILFKDITPVLANGPLLHAAIDGMAELVCDGGPVDKVVGIDARGFIFGSMLAQRLSCGFVPARKKGKLPWKTRGLDYALEYGTAHIEMHEDAIRPGERVVLADDLLATGGTAGAVLQLMKEFQANLVGSVFFIELGFLNGRTKVEGFGPTHSLITY